MTKDIRSLASTALLILGFSKASARLEGAGSRPSADPEAPTMYCLPCNCTE